MNIEANAYLIKSALPFSGLAGTGKGIIAKILKRSPSPMGEAALIAEPPTRYGTRQQENAMFDRLEKVPSLRKPEVYSRLGRRSPEFALAPGTNLSRQFVPFEEAAVPGQNVGNTAGANQIRPADFMRYTSARMKQACYLIRAALSAPTDAGMEA